MTSINCIYKLLVELQSQTQTQKEKDLAFFKNKIKAKIYYLRHFLNKTYILSKEDFDSPFKNIRFYDFRIKMLLKEQQFPDFFNKDKLANTLKSMKEFLKNNQIILDLLTYSTLPSLFNMFFIDRDLLDFIQFIKDLKEGQNDKEGEELQASFSRCLFVSPVFLAFIQKALSPIFYRFSNGQIKGISNEALRYEVNISQQKLLDSIKNNISYLPISIKLFINAMIEQGINLQNFLFQAFFAPMISFPESFLLFDFYEQSVYGKSQKIHDFIQKVFDSNFIEQFIRIVRASRSIKNCFVDQKYCTENVQSLTYFTVIDTFDCIAFDCISNRKEINFIDILKSDEKYSLFVSNFDSNPPPINKLLAFRKLIKTMKTFPGNFDFEKNPEIQSIHDIILHFSSQMTLESQMNYFLSKDLFNNELVDQNLNVIQAFIEKVKSIEDKTNIDRNYFINEFDNLNYETEDICREINLLFKTVFTQKVQISMEIPKIIEATQDPMKYNDIFEQDILPRFTNLAVQTAGKHKYYDIIYHYYFKNVHFYSYISLKPEFAKYDQLLYSLMITKFSSLFKLDNLGREAKKIRIEMQLALKNMSIFNVYARQFNEAFSMNSDPLTKINKLTSIFTSASNHLALKLDLNSADHLSEFVIILFLYMRPQKLYSNMMFLFDFQLFPKNKKMESNAFKNYIMFLFGFLNKQAGKEIISPQLQSPSFMKKFEIVVTGDCWELINDISKKFLNGINSNYVINSADIEKGNLLEIPCEFLRFENSGFDYFVKGKIRIQLKMSKRYSVDLSEFQSYVLICCQKNVDKEAASSIQTKYSNFYRNVKIVALECPDFPKDTKINDVVEVIPSSRFQWRKVLFNCI